MNAWEEVLEERKEAKAEERSVMNSLNKRLMEDGRMDDLRRSFDDEKYQESLLAEYGLGVDV